MMPIGNAMEHSNKVVSMNGHRSTNTTESNKLLWQWDLKTVQNWLDSLTIFLPKVPAITNKIDNEKWLKTQTFKRNMMISLQSASSGREDLYNIMDSSFSRGKDQIHTPGAILSRTALNGIINAIHGKIGGILSDPSGSLSNPTSDITNDEIKIARHLLHSISARVQMDMLNSTPSRIVEMLCPEMSMNDIEGVRSRIYKTVVLGKGTNSSAAAAALEGEEDVPVAAKVAQHDIDKFKKCSTCGNNDQSTFVLDRKNGDLICEHCGTVATESLLHEGSAFRKFEGEADRNHHGDVANPLYSNAHNMGTTLAGVAMETGAGIGWGSKKQGLEKILRHTHTITEMSLSQFGKEEKKTRVGYKDKQKKDAFVKMSHVANTLCLHDAVLQYAKVLFAGFRDDRELVQQFQGVLAACLWESFEQLSKDGKQILKTRAGEQDDNHSSSSMADVEVKRVGWRNEMHKASLAKKKPLDNVEVNIQAMSEQKLEPFEKKEAKLWDLDDCRSWLVKASKTIAESWVNQSEKTNNNNNVPKGSRDELEGQLVAHALTLCGHLESELSKKKKSTNNRVIRNGRAFTPRVTDMSKLGIRWQKPNERGSGGKGGVGNSGRSTLGIKPGEQSTLGAGQVLLLMTNKQFETLLSDNVAGKAFHQELKTLIGKQNLRKRKKLGAEVALTRAKQLKRKPWLSARAQAT